MRVQCDFFNILSVIVHEHKSVKKFSNSYTFIIYTCEHDDNKYPWIQIYMYVNINRRLYMYMHVFVHAHTCYIKFLTRFDVRAVRY